MHLAVLASLIVAAATPCLAATIEIPLDRTARISLGGPARDVVVGNPKVADVSLLDARNLVVLGKGYGATSLLVVDRNGRTIADHQIVVTSPDVGAMSFIRGGKVQSYACSARCESTDKDAAP
jgi:Flp pilus assembly secretin CpaC